MSAERPRVVVSVTMSVDGRVTLGRDRLLLGGEAAEAWRSLWPPSAPAVEEARSARLTALYHPQAVLEGSGTFVATGAGPLFPDEATGEANGEAVADFLPAEVVGRPGREQWFTVVDGRGRVRWTIKSQGDADLLVLVASSTPAAYLAYLRDERIPYLVAGGARVDLAAALGRMRERLGVTCVVSAAGGGLNGALLRAGLIDELQLIVLPAAVGGLGTPSLFDGPELGAGEAPARLRLLSTHAESDGTLWLRYEVRHGPA